LRESELWQSGKTVRSLRPENQKPAQEQSKEKKTAELLKKLVEKPESVG
jgi:ketol-acid reductoisomerase